ncbi:unnamed protein product [Boreogadus saida]
MLASSRSPAPEGPQRTPQGQHGLLRMVHVSLVVSSSLSTPKPRQQHPVYANHVCLGNRDGRRAWLWQAGRAVTQREEVNTGCLGERCANATREAGEARGENGVHIKAISAFMELELLLYQHRVSQHVPSLASPQSHSPETASAVGQPGLVEECCALRRIEGTHVAGLAELGSHAIIDAMLVDVSSLPNPWALGSPGATDINPGADLWFSLPVGLRPDAYSASAPPANGWPAWSPRQQQQLHGGEPLSVGGGCSRGLSCTELSAPENLQGPACFPELTPVHWSLSSPTSVDPALATSPLGMREADTRTNGAISGHTR